MSLRLYLVMLAVGVMTLMGGMYSLGTLEFEKAAIDLSTFTTWQMVFALSGICALLAALWWFQFWRNVTVPLVFGSAAYGFGAATLIPSPLLCHLIKAELPNSWWVMILTTLIFMVIGLVVALSVMDAIFKAEDPPPEPKLNCC